MKEVCFLLKGCLLLLAIIVPLSLFSQTEDLIKADIDSLRAGSSNIHDYSIDSTNERSILLLLKKYESDRNVRVRKHLRIIRAIIADKTADTLVKQEIVESYVQDCLSPEPYINQFAYERLPYFNEHDYSPKAKQLMVTVFNKGVYSGEFILACGMAQAKQLAPAFKKLAAGFNRKKAGWPSTPAWYACLALARMGEPEKIDTIITAVELELDASYRVGILLRYIAYTRHPDCVTLLRKYLQSTERFPSERDNNSGYPYSRHALNYMARYLNGFPVKYSDLGYSAEDVQAALEYYKEKDRKNFINH